MTDHLRDRVFAGGGIEDNSRATDDGAIAKSQRDGERSNWDRIANQTSSTRSLSMARATCLAVLPALLPSSSSTARRSWLSAARPSTSRASSSARSVRSISSRATMPTPARKRSNER
jgi:hypothetical protein